jgi:hypothetical protein
MSPPYSLNAGTNRCLPRFYLPHCLAKGLAGRLVEAADELRALGEKVEDVHAHDVASELRVTMAR